MGCAHSTAQVSDSMVVHEGPSAVSRPDHSRPEHAPNSPKPQPRVVIKPNSNSGNDLQVESAKSILGRMDDMRSLYTFDKVLGKGQFGVTRLVIDNRTGEQLACKSISKRKLVNAEDMEDVRREIKVMHHLSGHPHVVAFKGAYEDSHHIHIVMELCTGGLQLNSRRCHVVVWLAVVSCPGLHNLDPLNSAEVSRALELCTWQLYNALQHQVHWYLPCRW